MNPAPESKPWGLSVRALLMDAAGRCLLLRRAAGSRHFAGQWDLPGGKVEPGERLDAGLRREVREETGLDVEPLAVAGAGSFELPRIHVADMVFRVAVKAGTLQLSDEHSEARWCAPAELAGLDLAPSVRTLLRTNGSGPVPAAEEDSLRHWGEHLETQCAARGYASFDMDDAPDLPPVGSAPILQAALQWLGANLTPAWRAADAAAIASQTRHSLLARTALLAGAFAVILAILQLAVKIGGSGAQGSVGWLSGPAWWLEGIAALAATLAVVVGFRARAHRQWLGFRHRAERLRMLKFKALAHPALWEGRETEWQDSVGREMTGLPAEPEITSPSGKHPGATPLQALDSWAHKDTPEADPVTVRAPSVSSAEVRALRTYYHWKRLRCQSRYFEKKGGQARDHWAVCLRHWRLRFFTATMICVVLHFVGDLAKRPKLLGWVAAWQFLSVAGLALAAILPVVGLTIRALSDATELSRKAHSFAAKNAAMTDAAQRLQAGPDDLSFVLNRITHDELFLEQEHREWLRLLLDAEWFL